MSRKKKIRYLPSGQRYTLSSRELEARNDELRTHYHFDSADLYANRQGWITESQLTQLGQISHHRKILQRVGLPIYLVGVFGTCSLVCWPYLIGGSCLPIGMGLFAAYWIVHVVRETHYLNQLDVDRRDMQVEWVMGEAELAESLFYWTRKVLMLDRVTFMIDPKESSFLQALGMGGRGYRYTYPFHSGYWYTVYYVPHSKTIISAEISREQDFSANWSQSVVVMGADGEIEVG